MTRFGGRGALLLLPGPGFGDLSHPTTSLMLKMMHLYAPGASILDIGTGSGILALAALLLGARSAIGIDIDPHALTHARKNNRLNHLKARFTKTLPKNLPVSNVLLMNMILSEQRTVAPSNLNPIARLWIVSGILASQQSEYLSQASEWGWEPLSQYRQSEWLGWVFKKK